MGSRESSEETAADIHVRDDAMGRQCRSESGKTLSKAWRERTGLPAGFPA